VRLLIRCSRVGQVVGKGKGERGEVEDMSRE
jgi:hypothetical protein